MSGISEDFYKDLPVFSDFRKLSEPGNYRSLPADWFVVICDLRGSTAAIREGRYQDVNTLGAASIAALSAEWDTSEIPFVFGGDGASVLVPTSRIEYVKRVLLQLRNFARTNYKMDLRVGVVPVSEVLRNSTPIEVAKYEIVPKMAIAFIRGGGLTWAEKQIKTKPEVYCLTGEDSGVLESLTGLSCRWQPLPSRKGVVVSLLVRSVADDPRDYIDVLDRLERVTAAPLKDANPVSLQVMSYRSFWDMVRAEFGYERKILLSKSGLTRLFWIFYSYLGFKLSLPVGAPFQEYTRQIPSHSDFRKFDDMLRMVIDCTPQEVIELRHALDQMAREKRIHYGIHESDHALMTCFVGNLSEAGHIHFIDGGHGGYAMAASALKEQMART